MFEIGPSIIIALVSTSQVKMVKMLMILTSLTYALTAPHFIIQLMQCAVADYPDYFHDVSAAGYVAVMWVYFGSTASKPSLYILLNSNFRRGCKEVGYTVFHQLHVCVCTLHSRRFEAFLIV